ncbi:transposase-like protein [Nocardioides sp. BE266]|uniref:transposase family protein n=1 Tax=Nocardioides sp. BE266 TaxID=2817725 RepID=UPI0028667241|nr:transposase family protein [Nocardioides sp. BE266]MDR7253691.1 transposase-like protein [Nocardioides sp. BE266]
MQMTQRGQLSQEDERQLFAALREAKVAEGRFQLLAVEMVAKSSFREVARLMGLSTNTLQRWKREAVK